MPPVSSAISAGSTGVPENTIRSLHAELRAIGLPVAEAESSGTPRFGTDTQTRVREFQNLYRLPETSEVDPTTGALMSISALAATEADRTQLRAALRNARGAVSNSSSYDYWLARYAIMAGDYELAAGIGTRLRDLSGLAVDLSDGILTDASEPEPPRRPEVSFPENYYTYRYSVMSQEDIGALRESLAESVQFRPFLLPSRPSNGTSDTFDPPDEPVIWQPPPVRGSWPSRVERLQDSAMAWLGAIEAWQFGNAEFARKRYASAVDAYNRCQQATLSYFSVFPEYDFQYTAATLQTRMDELAWRIASENTVWADTWKQINWRRQLLSLAELSQFDWTPIGPGHIVYQLLEANLAGSDQPLPPTNPVGPVHRHMLIDARLLIIAAVLVPMARGEANRLRRQYMAAIDDFSRIVRSEVPVPNSATGQTIPARLACEFIELPFARLLLMETMLDQAESHYKARTTVDVDQQSALVDLAQEFISRQITGVSSNSTTPFQHLVAALTYAGVLEVMRNDGAYVGRVELAMARLNESVGSAIVAGDVNGWEFRTLGKSITVDTMSSVGNTLPGLTSGTHPHEPYLKFELPAGAPPIRERNPRVYALLLQAQARILQIWCGFNYLGYRDDYVPPWRFQYLLDRARYFSEHAKNAQRDYLNFLGNAENEEFKEMSVAQNVEMEKANVQIETARVDQVSKEVAAAHESAKLAGLQAVNAQKRLDNYLDFDRRMDRDSFFSLGAAMTGGLIGAKAGGGVGGAVGFLAGGLGAMAEADRGEAERALEKKNLRLAVTEAEQSKRVANAKLDEAKAGLVVAGLQRQAALLRHEHALQNLQFVRNRILNSEQWYRLAGAIRSVGETYLRYAIEFAFLAEQAYEFESDKRLNVIRFDYDLSEVGDFLAADFLLRDLDTLEKDLVVTQHQRQQAVRYVLSMAREFPEALQEIRDNGKATFSLRLEQIEKRFPGLYNLRIGAVDVLPVALLDSTRFSLNLTHLGTSQLRLKAQPDTAPGEPSLSPLNTNELPVSPDGWLAELQEAWPVKLRITGPETAVFSGLTRQDASTVFPFVSTGQRQAFEGLGAPGAWEVDFTTRDNRMVPESLADLLITFTLSGYHDPELRAAIDTVPPPSTAITSFFSARETFPDAFYEFNRTGRMVWKVAREMLALNGDMGRLRNIGVSLRPGMRDVHFSRLMTRLRMNLRIDESGGVASGVTVFTGIPEISITQTAPLTIAVRAALSSATELAWDFDDGTPVLRTVRSGSSPIAPAEDAHTYTKPGRYVIKLRSVQNNSLWELRFSVVLSRTNQLGDPLVVFPKIAFDDTAKTLTATIDGAIQQAERIMWRVGNLTAEGDNAAFALKPGHYTLDLAAVRKLNFRINGLQRYVTDMEALPLQGLSATTNRIFDEDGNETNGTSTPTPVPPRNELARRLFDEGAISPEDDWAFELIPEEILGLPAGTVGVAEELDLSEVHDLVLSMEYEITPVAP